MSGAQHVGEGEQGRDQRVVGAYGQLDQGAVGERNTGCLALAAVYAVHGPEAAVHAGGLQPCPAVFAGAV